MSNLKSQGLKKAFLFILFIFSLTNIFSLFCFAEGDVTIPEGFRDIEGILPDEALDALESEIFSEDTSKQGEALAKMLSPERVFSVITEIIGARIGGAARLFVTVTGLLILSSVLNAVRVSISSAALGAAMRFCMTGAMMTTVIGVQFSQLESVAQFFERLTSLVYAMLPVGASLLAMGGSVTTAASGSASLAVFLGVCETLCARTVIPVVCACTALALCNTLSSEIGLSGFASAIRKVYTFTLGTIMTLLISTLASQTALTAASDSAGARAAKLVSSAAIPIVGGTVGDTLRTVAGGVTYLKSIVGVSGIVFIALLLLPTLISLVLTRLVLLLTGGVADMLGCETEGKLLSELASVWGTMIAVVSMCAVMFILALVIFIRITVAAA